MSTVEEELRNLSDGEKASLDVNQKILLATLRASTGNTSDH